MNSGITADKVTAYDGYQATIEGKQNKLTTSNTINVNTDNTLTATGLRITPDDYLVSHIIDSTGTTAGDAFLYTYLTTANPNRELLVGSTYWPLKLVGNTTRPKYSNTLSQDDGVELALLSDVQAAGVPIMVTIDQPASATSGTLTDNQFTTLQASNQNYISFNNEEYYLFDKEHTEGYLTYSHVGIENNIHYIKTITINVSTGEWTLVVSNLDVANGNLPYLTTEPTADNTGGLKIVYLTSEPATKYNGYIYMIAEA